MRGYSSVTEAVARPWLAGACASKACLKKRVPVAAGQQFALEGLLEKVTFNSCMQAVAASCTPAAATHLVSSTAQAGISLPAATANCWFNAERRFSEQELEALVATVQKGLECYSGDGGACPCAVHAATDTGHKSTAITAQMDAPPQSSQASTRTATEALLCTFAEPPGADATTDTGTGININAAAAPTAAPEPEVRHMLTGQHVACCDKHVSSA